MVSSRLEPEDLDLEAKKSNYRSNTILRKKARWNLAGSFLSIISLTFLGLKFANLNLLVYNMIQLKGLS